MERASKYVMYVLVAAVLPLSAEAQQDPVTRLSEVLPPELVEQVVTRVDQAREMELPEQAVANLALEGVAKGRSAEEVLAAVDLLVADMGRAQEALQSTGRPVGPGEIEAATTALRMGVDGSAIAELAQSGPPGRSLTVPLLVLGGLAQRGLPSDQALEAVSERLSARAADAELLSTFGAPGSPASGRGGGPAGSRPDARGGGVDVPAGAPDGPGRPPEGRGRGNPNNGAPPGF